MSDFYINALSFSKKNNPFERCNFNREKLIPEAPKKKIDSNKF